jgi:hypothetical protein
MHTDVKVKVKIKVNAKLKVKAKVKKSLYRSEQAPRAPGVSGSQIAVK